MNYRQAVDFIRRHGVVLESAKGLEPTLTHRVAGGAIAGSWWGHPKGHEIFAILQYVHASSAIHVCTLANGRITYIHRRLWRSFVRLADKFPQHALDRVRQVHLETGQHQRRDIPFPDWVPGPLTKSADLLTAEDAVREIGVWLERYGRD